jgi:hypothetical protein
MLNLGAALFPFLPFHGGRGLWGSGKQGLFNQVAERYSWRAFMRRSAFSLKLVPGGRARNERRQSTSRNNRNGQSVCHDLHPRE